MARKKTTNPASPAITSRVTYGAKLVGTNPRRGVQESSRYATCVVGYTTPEGDRRAVEAQCAPDEVAETKAALKVKALELAAG